MIWFALGFFWHTNTRFGGFLLVSDLEVGSLLLCFFFLVLWSGAIFAVCGCGLKLFLRWCLVNILYRSHKRYPNLYE